MKQHQCHTIIFNPKSHYFLKEGQQMPSFEQDHQYLLKLWNIFEPTSQYSLDYTFPTIDNEITNYKW